MERLTIEYCGEYVPKELCSIDRLGGADDCDLCCEYCKATEEGNEDCRECEINKCFNKLGEYETLEEQGKLLKLPCVVGDMTYGVNKSMRWITDAIVKKIEIDADGIWVITSSGIFSVEDFEKTVFLTKEAAEAALKEMSE